MLKIVLNFLLVLSNVHVIFCYRNEAIKLLDAIVKLDNIPTSFIFKTCWSVNENLKMLHTLKTPIAFLTGDSLLEMPRDKGQEIMVVLDLNCTDNLNYIKQVNETYLKAPYRWTLLRSISDIDTSVDTLKAYPDSNIILATWNNVDTFLLQQFYRTGPFSNQMIYEDYGFWKESDGIVDQRLWPIISRRRNNLNAYPLVVSTVILDNSSLDHLLDYKDKTIDSVTKATFIQVNYVLDYLNASKTHLYSDTWGYYNPETKSINGMFGDVLSKTADITGTSIFITTERMPIIDYLSMVARTRPMFIFRAPPLSFLTNIYYLPFERNVWTSCIVLVIISCIVIYITFKASNTRFSIYFVSEQLRLSDVILFAVAAISQMGSSIEPKYFSGRIAATFFFISLLFLYTAYTANIVSLLQATTKSIKTLDNLYQSQMKFGVQETPYNHFFFPKQTDETRKKIYEKKIVPNLPGAFTNMSHGISLLRQGYYTFHCEVGIGFKHIEDTFYEHEKCGLQTMMYLQVEDPWVGIQKHSPYNEMAKVALFRVREHGMQIRENLRIYTKKPQCSSNGQNFESVRLIDCYFVIWILVYGILLSIIVFILERLTYGRLHKYEICLY